MENFLRIKNELGVRIRKDLELKNLTVLAQWLGVFAAIIHGIGSLRMLYLTFRYHWLSRDWYTDLFRYDPWLPSLRIIHYLTEDLSRMILPFGAVIVEVPYLTICFPRLVKSFCSWEAFVTCRQYIYYSVIMFSQGSNGIALAVWYGICMATSFLAMFLIAPTLLHIRRINESTSAAPKAMFYTSLTSVFLITLMDYFPFMFNGNAEHVGDFPTTMFDVDIGLWIMSTACVLYGSTSILYCCAWYRRHGVVASRVLGGSGVEPIALAFPGEGSGFITL